MLKENKPFFFHSGVFINASFLKTGKLVTFMINKLFLLLIILLSIKISAQTTNKDLPKYSKLFELEFSYQNGYIFPTNNFVRGNNAENEKINAFQTFSLKLIKQTIGKKIWEQLFNYPEYGLGIYLADFHNPEEIGLPIAFYGYFTAPFQRWEKFTLNYEAGFGVAFNWNNYSPSNAYNNAIGAKYTVYINLGMKVEYQLLKRFSIGLGVSLTHFSNGRLKAPNYGLNTIAPKISVIYKLYKPKLQFIKQNVPAFNKKNELYLSAFFGLKNIIYDSLNIAVSEKYEGESYYVFGLSTLFNRQVSYKSKIGLGIDFSYDGSVNAQIAVDNGQLQINGGAFSDKLQVSIFPSYELVINKVSIIIQPSFYIYRKKLKNQSPVFYQRVGLKYNFYKNFYVGLNLRAYQFHISDFIEWNIGYRISK